MADDKRIMEQLQAENEQERRRAEQAEAENIKLRQQIADMQANPK